MDMIRIIVSSDRQITLSLALLLFCGSCLPLFGQRSDNFTFIAIGDAGYPGPILDENAATIKSITATLHRNKRPLDAMVFLGDNFYPIGLNLYPVDRTWLISEVINPHAYTFLKLGPKNVHAVPGNHDYYCAALGPIPYGKCRDGNSMELALPVWTYHLHAPASARYPTYKGSRDSVELIFVNSPYFLLNDEEEWHNHLDTLENLLRASDTNASVKWRMMFLHHSPFSAGEHAGYNLWSEDKQRVVFRGCLVGEGDNPTKVIERLAGYSEDNCNPHYIKYKDSLLTRIVRSGATIHAMFGGHDHSLQLLAQRSRPPGTPGVFVVSGAGSKRSQVSSPRVDTTVGMYIYTHPINDNYYQGASIYGFAAGAVEDDELRVWFVDGATGEYADMGGGVTEFWIDSTGTLVRAE